MQVPGFVATDILRIDDRGQITDNWHLEDNLTFLKEIGSVSLFRSSKSVSSLFCHASTCFGIGSGFQLHSIQAN